MQTSSSLPQQRGQASLQQMPKSPESQTLGWGMYFKNIISNHIFKKRYSYRQTGRVGLRYADHDRVPQSPEINM